MSDDDRVKRPRLDRRSPLRSWATLFGAPSSEGRGDDEPERRGGVDDVVSRSVELGYRVIDDWMRQGQRAAQRLGEGPYDATAFTQDAQDLTARIAQHASDLFGLWLKLFEMAAAGGARAGMPPGTVAGTAPNGGAAHPAASATTAAAPLAVRVEVTSTIPTQVALDLRPDAAGRRLVVLALRAVDPEAPRLDDVAIGRDGDEGAFVARLRVPDDHPAGTYNGLILDEDTSRPVGTLSVRIGPPL